MSSRADPAYAELAVSTNFSFLRGASKPEELVLQAKGLGLTGIGVADRNTVAGVVRAHAMARAQKYRIAVGARLVFSDATPDILAYPQDRNGWACLTRLLTLGKDRAEKGDCILGLPDLLQDVENLNLIVMPPARVNGDAMLKLLRRLQGGPRSCAVWLAAGLLYRGDDRRRLARLRDIAATAMTPLIAVNDVLYHAPERRNLQDVVTCIREHCTLDTAGRLLMANAERHLKDGAEMTRLFGPAAAAIDESVRFFERCRFSLDELKPAYPSEFRGGYATPQEALVALAKQGALRRYPDGVPLSVQATMVKEFALIEELKAAPYFLTVYDIVRFAESKGILCQGRGSAANSVVCYCLGITAVSPERAGLLFERFMSRERQEPPDIDVDFEHERREEVIQHIYNHYKRRHAGMTAVVTSYRGRSAVRDVGKAFGLSKDVLDALASSVWGWSAQGVTHDQAQRAGLDPSDPRLNQVLALSEELLEFPRHLSQHVGGFVISETRLDDVVPIENAAMEDRTVIEWNKDDLDTLGILKVDILGLGMLSCLRRGFDLLKKHYGKTVTLYTLDEDDPAVFRMLQRADSVGVFQVESRAQMSMLPRLKPEKFYDLVIEVAIVRPGPIQGNMVHPYLRRKQGLDPVDFPSPDPRFGPPDELKGVLGRTLGVPLFQEQAMQIAITCAGFTAAEASQLRRSMAAFRRSGELAAFRERFVNGMTKRGYTKAFAENCFGQIEGFGKYGFPESHAASFALLVYASSWIKCYYPDVFAAAILNSQPMGFYAPAQLVRDAQEHRVEVRAVDVNHSDWDCTLEPEGERVARLHPKHATMADDIKTTHAVRLGLREVSGFSEEWAKRIEATRGAGYDSVRDLWLRTGLPPQALHKLAQADAFGSLGLNRRDAIWAVRALQRSGDKDNLPLFARVAMPASEPDAQLPAMPPGQQVIEDYRHLHLSLKAHPVAFLRADLDARRLTPHERLGAAPPGRRVTVGGLVLVRQRPGDGNAIFITLEDETGIANIILWPRTFEAYRPVVMGARMIAVSGILQNEKGVIHIVGDRFEDLTPLLGRLSEEAHRIDPTLPVDELKRPVPGSWRYPRQTLLPIDMAVASKPRAFQHPRSGDSFVDLAKDEPALDRLAAERDAKVLPKGRNFH